jgi:hypothetical protein
MSPVKPIRIWFETGDQDLFYPVTPMADGMHDWVLADERFAKVLADKGYHYQFLFARNAQGSNAACGARMAVEGVPDAIAFEGRDAEPADDDCGRVRLMESPQRIPFSRREKVDARSAAG